MTGPPATQGSGLPATAAQTSAERPWPVRLLTAKIGRYLMRMPSAWVEGQVVELTRRGDSPVAYLTLRDPDVDMSLSLTTGRRVLDSMPTPLVEGARVVARVVPEYWEKRGRFTLTALEIRPVGVGALLAQIEHLRQLMASEGLFDTARKKPLPFAPDVIGLVCGRDSAAEHDVLVNTHKRWPAARFKIHRVPVQGTGAVAALCQAIEELDRDPTVQVLVVARGGGSTEDLLPFSNETLIRTVAACRTPLVSAIGHEADTPLLDLVADLRASTPTDAARRVVPDLAAEAAHLATARQRARRVVAALVATEQAGLLSRSTRLESLSPSRVLAEHARAIDHLSATSHTIVRARLERARDSIDHLQARVVALSPKATLDRGYAVVLDSHARVLSDAADCAPGERLQVLLAAGRLHAIVEDADLD